GPEALEGWLRSLPAEAFGRTFIIEPGGREMLRRPLPPSSSGANDAARAPAPGTAAGAIAPLGGALELVAPGGGTYHVVVAPHRPRLFGELELPGVPLTPLARLQLALSLASREPSGVERHLARIAREAERLEQLIARTLKLASLERPGHTLEQARVDVGELLQTIAADVAIEAAARGCQVELAADGELALSGDPELLRSAFENVIRNAVRFSPTRGAVVVSARRRPADDRPQGGLIDVIVRDHGPGVPEKDLGLIFEPFY